MSGIYIHIPFCKQACSYCDFHFSTSLKKKSDLIQAIVKELVLRKDEISEPIETIYFGGGTPSILKIKEIKHIISTIYDNYNVINNPEITLEANPDDLSDSLRISDQDKEEGKSNNLNIFEQYKKAGINRLSIGIQSFFDEDLEFMKRAHNAKEAINSLSVAIRYFNNITIDLIYGTPTLSDENWRKNIQIALDLGINHISSYALTVEDKTLLSQQIKSKKIKPLDEEKAQNQFYVLKQTLEANGFTHYEISNFGKPTYLSKHNTAYWLGENYLGIGPSAHSFNGKQRSWNVANNTKYIKSLAENKLPSEIETLSKNDLYNETIMIGLRTIYGVSLEVIKNNFGETQLEYLLKKAVKHLNNKTLEISQNKLIATEKGLFFIDGIASDLFDVN